MSDAIAPRVHKGARSSKDRPAAWRGSQPLQWGVIKQWIVNTIVKHKHSCHELHRIASTNKVCTYLVTYLVNVQVSDQV